DALLSRSGDAAGRRKRQAERARIALVRLGLAGIGAGLALLRQLAERQRHGLLGALTDDAELDGRAGRDRADLLGQIAGVLDRRAVDTVDHVAGLDAGFGGRAVGLRLGHQRAFVLLPA